MPTSSNHPTSLTVERLFPRARRAAWRRDRTNFLIEDLNGHFFVLAGDHRERQLAAATRVREILAGARWMTGAAEDAWRYVQAGLFETTDAFGPAALLMATTRASATDQRINLWLANLPTEVRDALALVFNKPRT